MEAKEQAMQISLVSRQVAWGRNMPISVGGFFGFFSPFFSFHLWAKTPSHLHLTSIGVGV